MAKKKRGALNKLIDKGEAHAILEEVRSLGRTKELIARLPVANLLALIQERHPEWYPMMKRVLESTAVSQSTLNLAPVVAPQGAFDSKTFDRAREGVRVVMHYAEIEVRKSVLLFCASNPQHRATIRQVALQLGINLDMTPQLFDKYLRAYCAMLDSQAAQGPVALEVLKPQEVTA
jgi:hypothetical protein